MEDKKSVESHVSSAAAFVESGVQAACEDCCSICLEPFSDDDPATVTSCKHEYHLQCILEWAQRSNECPMCLQSLALKDPTSQELLAAVEQERSFRSNRSVTSSMFGRNSLDEFEFHHVPAYGDDSDLEERIMQHLAAAAMARPRHVSRRENHRQRSGQGHPQFVLFTTRSNPPPTSPNNSESHDGSSRISFASDTVSEEQFHQSPGSSSPLHRSARAFRNAGLFPRTPDYRSETNSPRGNTGQQYSENQESSRASELQSFSESLKSRFSAVSARYKESIARSTRSFKERLLSRNNAVGELGREVQREVSAGVARMMERFDSTNKNVNMSPTGSHTGSSSGGTEPVNMGESSQYIPNSKDTCGSSSSKIITESAVSPSRPLRDKDVCPTDEACSKNMEGDGTKKVDVCSTDALSSSD
eukprot:TRINITY_DN5191_c0_g1_i1.p1 TRINITY_DN5191_c0_g1~~TRINITY_DN5191_c0_g1_i1.p1  ORF type:complete len:417 (-),score=89.86 TRINITY_DN5191_c0_g1_i1:391-1641(-)